MATLPSQPVLPSIPRPAVPPLENGDHLTRAEFERRWDAVPHLARAELIEGKVYLSPPLSFEYHAHPHGIVMGWLAVYCAATPGVTFGDAGSVRLDPDNMPQPDGFAFVLPSHGGATRVDADSYVAGGPEFVIEVSASSASYDLHEKLNVYRRNGVREYVVLRTYDRAVDYFVLRDGRYDRLAPHASGTLRSEVIPGLWLDPQALIDAQLAVVLSRLQEGLASPEHAAFVAELGARAASGSQNPPPAGTLPAAQE